MIVEQLAGGEMRVLSLVVAVRRTLGRSEKLKGDLAAMVKSLELAVTARLWISFDAPELIPGIADSDHSSFWRNGARAAMVTDTAWYRNPRYHTARDTPDTLDYGRMARIVDGMAAWASSIPR